MSVVEEAVSMSAAEARENLAELINRVAYGDERIVLTRHGKALVAMVSIDDLEALDRYQDYLDGQLADEAWEEYQREGGIPIEVVEQQLQAELARLAEQRGTTIEVVKQELEAEFVRQAERS
jgi:prevent-host-death family protein